MNNSKDKRYCGHCGRAYRPKSSEEQVREYMRKYPRGIAKSELPGIREVMKLAGDDPTTYTPDIITTDTSNELQ